MGVVERCARHNSLIMPHLSSSGSPEAREYNPSVLRLYRSSFLQVEATAFVDESEQAVGDFVLNLADIGTESIIAAGALVMVRPTRVRRGLIKDELSSIQQCVDQDVQCKNEDLSP